MRIKEGQTLELKNGQTIGAEEETERFATVLLASALSYYLLYPQHYEEDRAFVETEGEDAVMQIAQEMYDKAVKVDEMIEMILDTFCRADLPEDEKETFLRYVNRAYFEGMGGQA